MADQAPNSEKPIWNSLEVTKLLVGLLTPLAIFAFTYYTNSAQTRETEARAAQRVHDEVERQQREKIETEERERFIQVLKYRAELWKTISPMMNDLYCYFLYVGHWKTLTPSSILKTKRDLDKYVYSNSPFFTSDFLQKYNAFMSATFQSGNGWGFDARLKSPPIRASDRGREQMFAREDDGRYMENTDAIHKAYFEWLAFAGSEMKLRTATPSKPQTPTAAEIGARLGKATYATVRPSNPGSAPDSRGRSSGAPSDNLIVYQSEWLAGGRSQQEVCSSGKASLQPRYPGRTITFHSADEQSKRDGSGRVEYRYSCKFQLQ